MDNESASAEARSATEQVIQFAERFGRPHLDLACHAAFPLVLTPEMLYQIWAAFVPHAPWTAVADVLLSSLCREIGYELYAMNGAVRNNLLKQLRANPDPAHAERRMRDLGYFLASYVAPLEESEDAGEQDLAEAQKLAAYVVLDPNLVINNLINQYSNIFEPTGEDRTATLRLSSLVSNLAGSMRFTAEAEQYHALQIYADGLKSLARGDREEAFLQLGSLPTRDGRIEIAGRGLPVMAFAEPLAADDTSHASSQSSGESSQAEVNELVLQARAYDAAGRYEEALAMYQRASAQRLNDPAILSGLGQTSISLGSLEQAVGYLEQALVLYRERRDSAGEAQVLFTVAVAYRQLHLERRALDSLEAALAIQTTIDDKKAQALILREMAVIHAVLGQVRPAEDLLKRALNRSREAGDVAGQAAALNHLASLFAARGRIKRAIEMYERSLKIVPPPASIPDQINTILEIIRLHRKSENYSAALSYATKWVEQLPDQVGILIERGRTYRDVGDLERAVEDFNSALQEQPENEELRHERDAAEKDFGATESQRPNINLTSEQRQRLVELLARIPGVESSAARDILLYGMPRRFLESVPRSPGVRMDLRSIVYAAEQWGSVEGQQPLLMLIDNAEAYVTGLALEAELDALRDEIVGSSLTRPDEVAATEDAKDTKQRSEPPAPKSDSAGTAEYASGPLLTADERRELSKLLLALPNLHDYPALMTVLLADLPTDIRNIVNFSSRRKIVVANILDAVDSAATRPLSDGRRPIIRLIDNAIEFANSAAPVGAADLMQLRDRLVERTRALEANRRTTIEELTPQLFQALHTALLNAFPSRSELQEMALYGLHENLESIVAPGSLANAVFALINWAQARGMLTELITGALARKPSHPELVALAVQLGLVSDPPPRRSVRLSATHRRRLYDALVYAFSDSRELEQMLGLELDVRLSEISEGQGLTELAFNVLEWAEREDRVADLIQAALATKPSNKRLAEVAAQIDLDTASQEDQPQTETTSQPATSNEVPKDGDRYEEALEDYRRSLELNPDHPDILTNRGITYERMGRYEEALEDFNRSLELRPHNPITLAYRGITYSNMNRHEAALADYNRSLEILPDDPATQNNRGLLYTRVGRYEEALADYNRSLELRPDDPDTLTNRGVLYSRMGRYEEALADYNRGLDFQPNDPVTLANRGLLYFEMGRYEEALEDFNRSLELRPDHPETLTNRGSVYFNMRRYEEALANYNRSLELQQDDPDTLTFRGLTYSRIGRYEEALADYNRSLELRPDYSVTLTHRGNTYARMGRHEEALADLNRSLELNPDFPDTFSNRGITYNGMGRYEEALADYKRSLELRPDDPVTLANRGILYSRMGRYEEALADLDHSLKLEPTFAAARQAREQLLAQKPPPGKTWDLETLG